MDNERSLSESCRETVKKFSGASAGLTLDSETLLSNIRKASVKLEEIVEHNNRNNPNPARAFSAFGGLR